MLPRLRLSFKNVKKNNVKLTFCVVTWVLMAPLRTPDSEVEFFILHLYFDDVKCYEHYSKSFSA